MIDLPAVLLGLFSPVESQPLDVLISTQTAAPSFEVKLAAGPFEQMRGLMFRPSLQEGQGMLFHYQSEQYVQFWVWMFGSMDQQVGRKPISLVNY
jgi:hypothetical protein